MQTSAKPQNVGTRSAVLWPHTYKSYSGRCNRDKNICFAHIANKLIKLILSAHEALHQRCPKYHFIAKLGGITVLQYNYYTVVASG